MDYDYPENLEQEEALRQNQSAQLLFVRPQTELEGKMPGLTKKEDSTSGLNDETKDGNFSSALDD